MNANQQTVTAGPPVQGRVTSAALSPEMQGAIAEMRIVQLEKRLAALESRVNGSCVTQDSRGHLNFPASDKILIQNTSRIEIRGYRPRRKHSSPSAGSRSTDGLLLRRLRRRSEDVFAKQAL